MFDRILEVLPEIGVAMGQTLTMLLVAIPLAVLLGTPLGVLLYTIGPNGLSTNQSCTACWTAWSTCSARSPS